MIPRKKYRVVHVPRRPEFKDNNYFTYWTRKSAERDCDSCNTLSELYRFPGRFEVEKFRK